MHTSCGIGCVLFLPLINITQDVRSGERGLIWFRAFIAGAHWTQFDHISDRAGRSPSNLVNNCSTLFISTVAHSKMVGIKEESKNNVMVRPVPCVGLAMRGMR